MTATGLSRDTRDKRTRPQTALRGHLVAGGAHRRPIPNPEPAQERTRQRMSSNRPVHAANGSGQERTRRSLFH